MANLAIKGHATRGKEVIEILEMLGGKNVANHDGSSERSFYFLNNTIICSSYCSGKILGIDCYTLEEFLEKFPYKVGDKVKCARINDFIGRIINARWDDNENQIIYVVEWNDITKSTLTYFANGLQPYKEETMEDIIKIDIPKGYEFAGFDDDKQQVVFEKIGCQYPKTYEECCEALLLKPERATYSVSGLEYKRHLIVNLQRLLICRDAYWKIAGEQMGLGKPWEPDWSNGDETKFCIYTTQNIISLDLFGVDNKILAFPTEEMRDAFYENFKDLIEQCKELL